jgi:hypothetical protein
MALPNIFNVRSVTQREIQFNVRSRDTSYSKCNKTLNLFHILTAPLISFFLHFVESVIINATVPCRPTTDYQNMKLSDICDRVIALLEISH